MKLFALLLLLSTSQISSPIEQVIEGAWRYHENGNTIILLFSDGYFTTTQYTANSFVQSAGGTYTIENNYLLVKEEFNTAAKELKEEGIEFELKNGKLILKKGNWKFDKEDNNDSPLSGVWKITKRMQGDSLVPIQQRGTRKTLKILTGTRFQWFAIDPASNAFYGSGGGSYSFKNGKYVENIEFFSRDSTRVGASLSFNDHIQNGAWHHTGLSSKGASIYEVWEKIQ